MFCGMFLDNKTTCKALINMNKIINKFLLAGDTRLLYRNELDKACFKHDAAYAKYKDVENRLVSDQKLKNSAYDITSNPKYDGYQRGLASMVYKFFDSKKLCQVKVMQSIRPSLVLWNVQKKLVKF